MTTTVYRERANRYRAEINTFLVLCGIAIIMLAGFDYWDSHKADWHLLSALPWLFVFWLLVDRGDGEKGPSTLKLDHQGLTYAYRFTIRCWAWTELSAAEIPSGGEEVDYYIRLLPDRRIDWKTRMTMPGIPLNGSELRIRAVFDAPLTEICTKVNEYRDRALGRGTVSDGSHAPLPV
jgi:hypothetical protein